MRFEKHLTAHAAFLGAAEATPAFAQRAAENALTSAENAFGATAGGEPIDLSSAANARRLSPVRADNVRHRGVEVSLNGSPSPGLTVIAGVAGLPVDARSRRSTIHTWRRSGTHSNPPPSPWWISVHAIASRSRMFSMSENTEPRALKGRSSPRHSENFRCC